MIPPAKKFNDFRKKWEGKKYDNDWAYGYQCVDLMRLWVKEAKFPPVTRYWNAIDLWEAWLGNNWERVYNSLYAKPKPWDIIFWKIWKYGHVWIAGQSNLMWVEILEQNAKGTGTGEGDDAIRFRKDFYSRCVWWFQPKT